MTFREIFLHASLIWAVVALVLLLLAWRAAVQGNIKRHRFLMIFLTTAAWVFIASYVLKHQLSAEVPDLSTALIIWLAVHGSVALIPLFGASFLVCARLWQMRHPQSRLHLNRHHRIYGRVIVALWVFTHCGGIVNYWLFIPKTF